jgi:hypothetical protein
MDVSGGRVTFGCYAKKTQSFLGAAGLTFFKRSGVHLLRKDLQVKKGALVHPNGILQSIDKNGWNNQTASIVQCC